jgi:hypothetical protein
MLLFLNEMSRKDNIFALIETMCGRIGERMMTWGDVQACRRFRAITANCSAGILPGSAATPT